MPSSEAHPHSDHDLPTELVLHILLYATDDGSTTRDAPHLNPNTLILSPHWEETTALLAACSLVSRTWGHIARSLLYKTVTLTRPRAALRFTRTLDAVPPRGALVTTLVLWTSIYAKPGTAGQFSRREKSFPLLSRSTSRRRCDDRFLDAVSRRCPNLTRLCVQNRSAARTPLMIVLPPMDRCAPTLFSRLRCLELDVYRKSESAPVSPTRTLGFVAAFVAGKLELPDLEQMTLLRLTSHSALTSQRWLATHPRLRHLTIIDGTLSCLLCWSLLTSTSHPTLHTLHLVKVTLHPGAFYFRFPPSLTVLALHHCIVFPSKLPHLLAACAPSLEALELVDTRSSSVPDRASLPPWPHFPRLARLRLGWETLDTWGLSLLHHALPALATLEVQNDAEVVQLATEFLDVLSSRAQTVHALTLRGNPYIDAEHLSSTLHAMPRLRSLCIGAGIAELVPEVLLRLPANVRSLRLCMDEIGAEDVVEAFRLQLERFRSGSSCAVDEWEHLETIEIVSTSAEERMQNDRAGARQLSTLTSPRNTDSLLKLGVQLFSERNEIATTLSLLDWTGSTPTPTSEARTPLVPWHTTIEAQWLPLHLRVLGTFHAIAKNRLTRKLVHGWLSLLTYTLVLTLGVLLWFLGVSALAVADVVGLPAWYLVVRPCSILLCYLLR